jgi:hypothetical protein
MGDWLSERRFASGTFRINVNPLTVFGGFSKTVDAILRHCKPIANGNFLTDVIM